jgi:hypothetical protein
MGASVPVGSVVTYTGTWHVGYFTSVQDVINKVGLGLLNNDGITVKTASGGILGAVGAIDNYLGGPAEMTVTMDVQITGGSGFGSVDDVASIVNHEAYQATGTLPTVFSTPKVKLPGAVSASGFLDWLSSLFTGASSTGQPSASNSGFSLAGLGSSGVLYISLAIFGFVAALALIGYSGALRSRAT